MGWIHGNENVEPFVGSAGTPSSLSPLPPKEAVSSETWMLILQNAVEEYRREWGEGSEEEIAALLAWFEQREGMEELASFLNERGWTGLSSVTEMTVALDCAQQSLASVLM